MLVDAGVQYDIPACVCFTRFYTEYLRMIYSCKTGLFCFFTRFHPSFIHNPQKTIFFFKCFNLLLWVGKYSLKYFTGLYVS